MRESVCGHPTSHTNEVSTVAKNSKSKTVEFVSDVEGVTKGAQIIVKRGEKQQTVRYVPADEALAYPGLSDSATKALKDENVANIKKHMGDATLTVSADAQRWEM